MIHESKAAPSFYPIEFAELADDLLQVSMSITRDQITRENCERIYKCLINGL